MAGIRLARSANVMRLPVNSAMGLYLALAVCSFAAAQIWLSGKHVMSGPELTVIHVYRHVIGQLDGRACPSYPVCSSYASQAIEKHGILFGSWLAMDRIIHEGDDLKYGTWIHIDGEQRLYDPLKHNDFWLNTTQENMR